MQAASALHDFTTSSTNPPSSLRSLLQQPPRSLGEETVANSGKGTGVRFEHDFVGDA